MDDEMPIWMVKVTLILGVLAMIYLFVYVPYQLACFGKRCAHPFVKTYDDCINYYSNRYSSQWGEQARTKAVDYCVVWRGE